MVCFKITSNQIVLKFGLKKFGYNFLQHTYVCGLVKCELRVANASYE